SSRRRHTRWPRDWSSDVCSSDLSANAGHRQIAKGSESESQPSRLNGRGGWSGITLFAKLERRTRLPDRSKLFSAGQLLARVKGPQMPIPSGRNHSCSVAGECAEAAICPWHPCCFDL